MIYKIKDLFHAETVALIELVNGNERFKIPEFQRPYSWRNNEEILRFLEDVLDSKNTAEDPNSSIETYFIGPMITYREEKKSENLVIDGQQRFTTIILIITALRDLLKAVDSDEWRDYNEYLNYKDKSLAGQNKYESRLSLSNRDAVRYFQDLIDPEEAKDPHLDGDAEVIHKAYNYIKKYLGSPEYGLNGDEQEAKDFVNHLLNNVGLTWIRAADLDQALMVFERMNDRGKDLSISDLIKYYLFTGKSLDDLGEDTQKIDNKWENLRKKLSKGENTKYPKLDRFFKYFITSRYMEKGVLQEKKIIDWIKSEDKSNNLKIAKDPIKFLDRLDIEMTDYVNILKKRYPEHLNEDGNVMALKRLSSFGKEIRQHLPILLSASREKYSKSDYEKLCESIENLALVWKLTKSQWNEVEKNLAIWSSQIRNGVPVDEFIENNIRKLIKSKASDIPKELLDMSEKPKTLTKYLLVRMEHHLREKMKIPYELWDWGKDGVLQLEHILAEKYTDESIPSRKSREYMDNLVWDLGNLTILTPYPNNAANNDPVFKKFEDKIFEDSVYILSQTIQSNDIEYKNKKATSGQKKHLTALDHKVVKLENNYWDKKEIQQRREFYLKILNEILFGKESKFLLK